MKAVRRSYRVDFRLGPGQPASSARCPARGAGPTAPPGPPADEAEWVYSHAGEWVGPVSFRVLSDLVSGGRLPPTVLVRRHGMVDWVPFAYLPAPSPTPLPQADEPTPLPGEGEPAAYRPAAPKAGWFYLAADGRRVGPVAFRRLGALLACGELTQGDLVWREGLPHWTPVASLHGLTAPGRSTSPEAGARSRKARRRRRP